LEILSSPKLNVYQYHRCKTKPRIQNNGSRRFSSIDKYRKTTLQVIANNSRIFGKYEGETCKRNNIYRNVFNVEIFQIVHMRSKKIVSPDFSYDQPRTALPFELIEIRYSTLEGVKKDKKYGDTWNFYNMFTYDKYNRTKEIWFKNVWPLLK